ncbi:unnamed protein product [Rhizophagus irregularis]|nr:unnamed protein product [Rhizophagus irregularis]
MHNSYPEMYMGEFVAITDFRPLAPSPVFKIQRKPMSQLFGISALRFSALRFKDMTHFNNRWFKCPGSSALVLKFQLFGNFGALTFWLRSFFVLSLFHSLTLC